MIKFKIKNIFSILLFFTVCTQIVFALDDENILSTSSNISDNTYFSTWWIYTKYYNKDTNSDIVWDYLWGHYYNKNYWFFQLDWSADKLQNVRIIWSTSKCSSWYWYRFDWYAKSETWWFIDFWYDKDTYVYYCVWDKRLYWKAYFPAVWEISFDGILLEILPPSATPTVNNSKDAFFVNNTTIIFWNTDWNNYNTDINLSWEKKWAKYWAESVFYIWKQKK